MLDIWGVSLPASALHVASHVFSRKEKSGNAIREHQPMTEICSITLRICYFVNSGIAKSMGQFEYHGQTNFDLNLTFEQI